MSSIRRAHASSVHRSIYISGIAMRHIGDLVRGVVADQVDVDKAVTRRLASGWKLERIDATARSILRAGAYELMRRGDVPAEVAIDEYVEIAKSFFEGPEPGFINAALDAIARDARSEGGRA